MNIADNIAMQTFASIHTQIPNDQISTIRAQAKAEVSHKNGKGNTFPP